MNLTAPPPADTPRIADPAHILVVEDEVVIAAILEDALTSHGYRVSLAADGLEAWERLEAGQDRFASILLDRSMPRLDGMQLLARLKADERFASIPVIMQTAVGDPKSVREGIESGAYYYLTKPYKPELMLALVNAAVRQHREDMGLRESIRQAERPFALLDYGRFRFRSIDESRMLANFFARGCPKPERVGLGLQELLINAVEHGNLGITYREKGQLVLENQWHDEVDRRLNQPQFADRFVEVTFERTAEEITFTIRDQGEGFDWSRYLDFDPERAFDAHGRGIAMARRMSFDALEYLGKGNVVVARIDLRADHNQDSQAS